MRHEQNLIKRGLSNSGEMFDCPRCNMTQYLQPKFLYPALSKFFLPVGIRLVLHKICVILTIPSIADNSLLYLSLWADISVLQFFFKQPVPNLQPDNPISNTRVTISWVS